MADMLATANDLNALLGETVDPTTATLVLETATGAVQAAAGQRLVQVVDDDLTIMGTTDSWLDLPQRPVTAVTSVTLDGTAVADWSRFGARLFRSSGWASSATEPSVVEVVYTHGYADGDQGLQLARQVALMVAVNQYANPTGSTSLSIDDYREGFAGNAGETWLTSGIRTALRRTYGRRGGMVRLG